MSFKKISDHPALYFSDSQLYFPTLIVGDIHKSLAIDARELFHGWSKFVDAVDPCKTDLSLCLERLLELLKMDNRQADYIVVLGGFCGRLDRIFGSINSLLLAQKLTHTPIYGIDGRNLVFVLDKVCYLVA